jgi:hypothetical protein
MIRFILIFIYSIRVIKSRRIRWVGQVAGTFCYETLN